MTTAEVQAQQGDLVLHRDSARGLYILAAAHLPTPQPDWFSPQAWAADAQPVATGGRGAAWFVNAPFADAVLRQYRRGGLVARFNRAHYLWHGLEAARSISELRLTAQLYAQGLPVPQPLAALVQKRGLFYQAAILITRLPQVNTLAQLLQQGAPIAWPAIGAMLAQFHQVGLYHADLNAHNILINAQGQCWLIDFDRCALRPLQRDWQQANYQRLLRSLHKLHAQQPVLEDTALVQGIAQMTQAYQQKMRP